MVSEEQNSEMELASEVIPVPQVLPEVDNVNKKDMILINNGVENINNEDVSHRVKNPRERKKALCAAIRKQMEFYFSDSNLSKDRFLAGLIKKNPEVDIEVFSRCNRIKTLTTDINLIVKALKKSTMLEVSEDGSKVRRITPIVEKQNIDECTVYIQGLPSDADHDWITNLFSEFGTVAYVSIPKFKYNNKIKGFAFIEFGTPEEAEKCLKAFRAKGCELPSQTAPTDVLSITTFNEEEKEEKAINNSKKLKENSNKKLKEEEEPSESGESKTKKRKKTKFLKSYEKEGEVELENSKNQGKHGDIDTINEEKQENSGVENDTDRENNEEKSKSRKRKKKSMDHNDIKEDQLENSLKLKKSKIENVGDSSSCLSDAIVDEEKRGKKRKNRSSEGIQETDNETKHSQKIKKMKSEEIVSDQENTENVNSNGDNNDISMECENTDGIEKKKKKKRKRNHHPREVIKAANLGLQVMDKKSWKRLRNKYLELQRAKMKQLKQHMRNARWNQWGEKNKMDCEYEETSMNKKDNPASNLEFTAGVIVKVELPEACIDPKGFKAEMKNHSGKIKYVDIKEGSSVAFVRCESSEAAATLAEESNNERCSTVLKGEEEKAYWAKIAKDRKEKIENKIRPKHRGRDKLLKKAEKELGKHIKFDEV